jgi:molecular chaperone DnaK
VLSDLGVLGCDDNGNELELDLTITREMANPVMSPFFERAIAICKKILERNNLDGSQLSKLILVGGPTYSPYLRQMLKEQLTPNVDTSIDPMTAVAKGAALYAATRDIPEEYVKAAETNTMEVELHYDTMSVDSTSYLAVKVKNPDVMTEGMSVEVVRADGAWRSGNIPYEDGGIVVELSLVERSANNFSVNFYNGCGQNVKIYPDSLTVLQGMQVSAAPLPYNIGFGVWNSEMERQTYVPFFGLEKGKPLPAKGIALGRKTTMRLVPGEESSILRIPVYQASNGEPNTPATLHEHVADVVITGKDVKNEVPAGSEVTIQVAADSSEMMTFTVSILNTDEEVVKKLDTSPRFNEEDSAYLIEEYADEARRTLESLESENVVVDTLKSRLHILKMSRHYTETKAIVEKYKELLRDIYDLECSTAWERIIRKVEREMAILKLSVLNNGQADDKKVFLFIERYIESAKENQDVTAAKKILEEIELLSIDLKWKTRIPSLIRWYDRYFDTTEWEDNKRARTAVDKALELLETSFSKEELMKAFRSIICALKNSDEIREAQGLLG